MESILPILLSLAAGAFFSAWTLQKKHAPVLRERDVLATKLEAEILHQAQLLASQKKTAETLQEQFLNSFEGVASKALKHNREDFLSATGLKLEPITRQLSALTLATGNLEKLEEKADSLGRRSDALATALRGSSTARGQWGEQSVERILEMAGMKKGVHYITQTVTKDKLRPDFQILLAGTNNRIPLDAKAPFTAYYDSLEETDPHRKKEFLKLHEQNVRVHIRELASKDYQSSVEGDVDFTVMFLPGDHLLDAAFEQNPNLLEDAWKSRVLLATPVTLLSLLTTVAFHWSRVEQTANVQEIAKAAQELHSRMRIFTSHLEKIGTHMDRATKSYNEAVGSYNLKVLPQGRRLEGMQATDAGKIIAELAPLERAVRKDLDALPEHEDKTT